MGFLVKGTFTLKGPCREGAEEVNAAAALLASFLPNLLLGLLLAVAKGKSVGKGGRPE